MATTATGPRGVKDLGASGVASAMDSGGWDGPEVGQGGSTRGRGLVDGSDERGVDGVSVCSISPALLMQVDPENYEFGCKEIEVRTRCV